MFLPINVVLFIFNFEGTLWYIVQIIIIIKLKIIGQFIKLFNIPEDITRALNTRNL